MKTYILAFLAAMIISGCQTKESGSKAKATLVKPQLTAAQAAALDTAYLASGCFWCTEAVFERLDGVADVVSGYTGGTRQDPTYEQVSAGLTNHAEAVRVAYDTETVDYETIIRVFFAAHDPTQVDGQGPDIGKQYRSGIFYQTEDEKRIAEAIKEELDASDKFTSPIVTEITPFTVFWVAEDYHQDYYELHPENPYIQNVSKPKVEKFMKEYHNKLKAQFQ